MAAPAAHADAPGEATPPVNWLEGTHAFVLSHAGKPVFATGGSDAELVPLAAVMQALVSFVRDTGDELRHVIAGDRCVVFLARGPLYLVAVTSAYEPSPLVARMLHYLHLQIILILTSSVETVLGRNASYDLRTLLGGTDKALRNVVRSLHTSAEMLVDAVPCVRLPAGTRAEYGRVLQATNANLLFAVLTCAGAVVTVVRPKRTALRATDIILLHNFINSSTSLRKSESWVPLCLPAFNSAGFVYAHVSFLAEAAGLCLLLITADANDFDRVALAKAQVAAALQGELLAPLLRAAARGGIDVAELGIHELRHFVFREHSSDQYVAPRFAHHPRGEPARVLGLYHGLHARAQAVEPPHKVVFTAAAHGAALLLATADYDLYIALGPLCTKTVAMAVSQRVLHWLKAERSSVLLEKQLTWPS